MRSNYDNNNNNHIKSTTIATATNSTKMSFFDQSKNNYKIEARRKSVTSMDYGTIKFS
jgi:signal recognition particle receptor subunit beta